MQPEHHIYSLKGILDSDRIDPDLCRLMLHQIKSPLLDHSFQMTADDDITDQNQGSFMLNDKTANSYSPIRPQPPNHNNLDSYSVTNSYYQTSRKADNYESRYKQNQPVYNHIQEKFAESIVSPLEHYKFLGEDKSDKDFFHIIFPEQSKPDKEKALQGPGRWCGDIFNPNLEDYTKEIAYNPQDFHYVRRKIFKKDRVPKIPESKQTYTFEQCAGRLKHINEPQLANFIVFISKCLPPLKRLVPYYRSLDKNSSVLNQILLQNSPVNFETRGSYQNKKRILNRLQIYETSDMLKKLSFQGQKYTQNNSRNQLRDYVQSDIQEIFKVLNDVEDTIENYVSRQDCTEQLKAVHSLLYQSSGSWENGEPGSPIQSLKMTRNDAIKNERMKHSLKIKLIRLFSSLKIDESLLDDLGELRYIWSNIDEVGGYDEQHIFIKQICRNDILIAPKSPYPINRDLSPKDQTIIKKLQMEGFSKNV